MKHTSFMTLVWRKKKSFIEGTTDMTIDDDDLISGLWRSESSGSSQPHHGGVEFKLGIEHYIRLYNSSRTYLYKLGIQHHSRLYISSRTYLYSRLYSSSRTYLYKLGIQDHSRLYNSSRTYLYMCSAHVDRAEHQALRLERYTEELQSPSRLYKRSAAGLTGQPASNTLLYHISIKYV